MTTLVQPRPAPSEVDLQAASTRPGPGVLDALATTPGGLDPGEAARRWPYTDRTR